MENTGSPAMKTQRTHFKSVRAHYNLGRDAIPFHQYEIIRASLCPKLEELERLGLLLGKSSTKLLHEVSGVTIDETINGCLQAGKGYQSTTCSKGYNLQRF